MRFLTQSCDIFHFPTLRCAHYSMYAMRAQSTFCLCPQIVYHRSLNQRRLMQVVSDLLKYSCMCTEYHF
jgi:hypothetical protein